MAYLIELDMVDFYVILAMDKMHVCYSSKDCRTRVHKFKIPDDVAIECTSSSEVPKD